MSWQPISTAPKDGTKIDIMAKLWRPQCDDFVFDRFPSCYWRKQSTMMDPAPHWANFNNSYHAVAWMPIPEFNPEEAK
jgi:hypothetical protein